MVMKTKPSIVDNQGLDRLIGNASATREDLTSKPAATDGHEENSEIVSDAVVQKMFKSVDGDRLQSAEGKKEKDTMKFQIEYSKKVHLLTKACVGFSEEKTLREYIENAIIEKNRRVLKEAKVDLSFINAFE